ncbi:MAG: HNH endonuclease [Planctomycetaceae bacterium]
MKLLRTQGACFYCGRIFGEGDWHTLDHLIPLAAGGTDDPDNLLLACWRCNKRKADGTVYGLAADIRRGRVLRHRFEIACVNRKARNRIAEARRRERLAALSGKTSAVDADSLR